ncbi:MAG: MobF family relaxase, partial [Candidatus Latescibacterota bacterium]
VAGVHPRSGEVLAATAHGRSERQAGWDFVCSADKSVSLVALGLGDERLLAAHDAAVRQAVEYLERHAAARVRGGKGVETTGRIAAALFREEESRALEPQLHTHVVVANVTRREDGQWRAVQEIDMYRAQRTATGVYRAEMARSIAKLGYAVEVRKDGEVGIAGITREQMERWSSRRAEIVRRCAERGSTPDRMGQLVARSSRRPKTHEPPERLRARWRAEVRAAKLKPAKAPLLRRREKPAQVAGEAVERALEHLGERRAVIETRQLHSEALRRGLGRGVVLADIERALAARTDLHRSPDGRTLATAEMAQIEARILQLEERGRGRAPSTISPWGVGADAQLTDEQRAAVAGVLGSRDYVMAIEGRPGGGKTHALHELVRAAEASGWQVRGLAPTGRATEALADAGIRERATVHGFLASREGERQDGLWIVDEAGLLAVRAQRCERPG